MTTRAGGPAGSGAKLSKTTDKVVLGAGSTAKVTQGTDPWLVQVQSASMDDLLRIMAEDLHDIKQLLVLALSG